MRYILDFRRAIRRFHRARLLRRRRHYWGSASRFWPDPAGPEVVDTPKRCSCWMCGNPRRYEKKSKRRTLQEVKAMLAEKDEQELST